MKLSTKIKKSWWILFSFIPLFNGVGFVYIGNKTNNKNWIIEGLIYEIPWFFSLIYVNQEKYLTGLAVIISILIIISIIRSFIVAILLMKAYESEEKRTFAYNSVNVSNKMEGNGNRSNNINNGSTINSTNSTANDTANNTNDSKKTSTSKSKINISNKTSGDKSNKSDSEDSWKGCCICLIGIFIILGFVSIL